MQVVKQQKDFGLGIFLLDGDKNFSITFGGNGDLYWSIRSKEESSKKEFIITKENYEVYSLFEQLFDDIENIRIFDEIDVPFDMEDEDEIREYIINCQRDIDEEKCRYREDNCGNYNRLYDKDNNIITWYSDEAAYEVANILRIKKGQESFKIEFEIQEPKNGFDEDFHTHKYIPIRFRNSGSSYFPFNMIFMKMYNNMKEIDDVNDYGHQVHMEEYLLSLKK